MTKNSLVEIRKEFLNFYHEKLHEIIPSASLIPDDPSVMLTIAGMLPFKPVFLGLKERPSKRATSSQKCIRTNDIENDGVTARHHTFFEMLGNFSFGDYFKKEAIEWAWELVTDIYGLSAENIIVSVFHEDDDSVKIWKEDIGIHPQRIIKLGEKDNFWSSGKTGPCGPCSELYYDFKPEKGLQNIDLEDGDRFIEFYNLVFMQYNRDPDGQLTDLKYKNIDTGMGLERMAQILQKKKNNYETDLIFPIIQKVSGINIKLEDQSLDANELLNYTKQKESGETQIVQLEKKQNILNRNNEDELNEMEILEASLSDVKKDLIQTSKLVKDEWKIIDEKLGLFELEKKELLTNFPEKVQNLYDELKTRGVDVIAAYRLENNQCGCCGVDLTTSELDSIFEKEFQQCPYCDGVLV